MSTLPSLIETIKSKISSFLDIRKPWIVKAIKYVWIVFLCLLIGFPIYIFTVKINLFGLYGNMPSIAEVENPDNDLSSEVLSADGVSLGRYFRYNRSQVSYEELSDDLVNTLIISEDVRFRNHSGLDFRAYVRAFMGVLTFSSRGGASTITQQLAKNLYTLNPDRSLDGSLSRLGRFPRRIIQKTKEWIIAVQLEERFTKEEILAMYLNTVNFSSGSFGIKVAAETYFGKEPDSLNLQESAVLVGMLQAPSAFHPKNHPEASLSKRNQVLYKVYSEGYKIKTEKQFDSIRALPIELKYKVQNQNEGLATYFRTVLGNYLLSYCKSKGIDLYNSGLKIYTTIDSRLQRYAEEAMEEHMKTLQAQFFKEWKSRGHNPWVDDDNNEVRDFLQKRIKNTDSYRAFAEHYGENSDSLNIMLNMKRKMTVFTWSGERDTLFSAYDSLSYYKHFLNSGLMSADPNTGHIKAWVGGINHKYFKFDHVRQSKRQPGSTFKPFVYGLAMEMGYSPCHPMKDVSPQYREVNGRTWNPKNATPPYFGTGKTMTIRQAMARSVNSISAQMILALGPENVVRFAHDVGIESRLEPNPSLCLGTDEVSLYELVGAYGTFVNGGFSTKPIFITRIEDKNGNVIENFVPKTKQAIDEQTAYKMVYMLRGGLEEKGGSSGSITSDVRQNNEVGGKTGTTDNASDGWYMGVTHNLVTGVWVGGDERSIHFPSWSFGQGGRTGLPIWNKYMSKVYEDPSTGVTKGYFRQPASGVGMSFSCPKNETDDDDDKQIKPDDETWNIKNN